MFKPLEVCDKESVQVRWTRRESWEEPARRHAPAQHNMKENIVKLAWSVAAVVVGLYVWTKVIAPRVG